ncbi:MAG TPA: RES family NAD+ phosphorylase [Gemmataceae bacterium]|nr:RES family NAD+ phosphorylase [Gemmataceae bacterium]
MPVNPALAVTIPVGVPFYRITAVSFHTPSLVHHKKVVNGMGARKSHSGARYNYGGVLTVYLADSVATCFAEKMFYFQREIVRRLDALHLPFSPGVPAFSGTFTLWEIRLKKSIPNICHLTPANASIVGVFPSLMVNPSQDYEHLKERRAFLESSGYQGIRAPSSRSTAGGEIIVLFDDQSKNVDLDPYTVELRLMTRPPVAPFSNHLIEVLDFTAGEARFACSGPPGVTGYAHWSRVAFNH